MPSTDRPTGDRRRRGRGRVLAVVLGSVALTGVGLLVAANLVVVTAAEDDLTREVEDLEPAQAVIVPGAGVYADGSLGVPVRERVDAAVELYDAGLVEKILLSGDNGTDTYNEPDAMRRAVLDAGVPPEDVFTDYAGFDTWHTMRRAADVFGVESAVVVTQGVYAARTVRLGQGAGIATQGYVVSDGGRRAREWLARVTGLYEAVRRPAVTPGDPIPITGDGRASWSEQPG
ncbi:hypothetical protein GCM10009821_28370 [Aeromicrobium halocynthiae]|uniref:DUF218 domain-containing protein n=1 Tax=Aeromicrobium halocynthiae TaxID=560557 RepID=A0ABN2W6R3_9ACTN